MFKNNKISVVIPAYNEEKSIASVILTVPSFVDHVLVVNDGSTDQTTEIAKERGAILINHVINKGVGAAFRSGVRKSLELNSDIMVNMDADGQFNSEDITKLIEPIIEKRADFVTASRFKNPDFYPQMSRIKFIGNRLMSWLISNLVGQKYYDVSCGFRAYSKEALLRLNLFGEFTYTQETFLDLAFKGMSIVEVPVLVRGTREYGQSKVASNLFNYTYQTLKIILRTLRDYRIFKVFSFISSFFLLIGVVFGSFSLIYYLRFNFFSPYKWVAFAAGFSILFSLLTIMAGFIIDIFSRIRYNQEETLYQIKKIIFLKNNQRVDTPDYKL